MPFAIIGANIVSEWLVTRHDWRDAAEQLHFVCCWFVLRCIGSHLAERTLRCWILLHWWSKHVRACRWCDWQCLQCWILLPIGFGDTNSMW